MIQVILILWSILPLGLCNPLKSQLCGYATCPVTNPGKINIHLVPHSHDDVGWLQTVDGYYYGHGGQWIYENAAVQYIITSTVLALMKDPNRKFIQVESAFLSMWWDEQNDDMRDNFRRLVNTGQLEIVNGAWSMNDEAAVHYQSTIDQYTFGLRFLNDELGFCGRPKVGWQIDPFGHSREHASILKQLGFDGFVIGRLDFRDKVKRRAEKTLDFAWKSSANLNNSEIFTTIFPDFYLSPNTYCWDVLCDDAPIIDDPDSSDYNLPSRVSNFALRMDEYSKYYKTNNVLVPMGGDFQYQAAEINFINMDRLIRGFEGHDNFNVFYSTPSCYMKAVQDEIRSKSIELPTKTDDFFPYASDPHAYWTGYFTSRPTSKRFERTGNNYLQTVAQLFASRRISGGVNLEESIKKMRKAMGIMQHHDAITGTEKQAVANDYARLLSVAIDSAESDLGLAIINHLRRSQESHITLQLKNCLLANVSICQSSSKDRFLVTVYNPLSRNVSHYVRLPVKDATYKITGPDGEEVYDIFDPINNFDYIPNKTPSKDLVFKANNIGPFGIKVYYVEKVSSQSSNSDVSDDTIFGDQKLGFTIDDKTGLLSSVTIQQQTLEITQEFYHYFGDVGSNNGNERSSGAYIFRPKYSEAIQVTTQPPTVASQKGNLVDEVKQIINDEITQIIRLYKDDESYIEFDWLVGNLQLSEIVPYGKEIITRFSVKNFTGEGTFYTDSNGREEIKRQLNRRLDYDYDASEEPAASNYYPVTSRITIKDQERNLQVAVLNDRAQGGSSLSEGQLELMVHRRLTNDDAFGVNEVLNEREFGRGLTARGQHWLTFGPTRTDLTSVKSTSAIERILAKKKLLRPWILVADATGEDQYLDRIKTLLNFSFNGLTRSLPDNVNILTFDMYNEDTYILRLEHLLEKGEDDSSAPVTIQLKGLFTNFEITEIRETTLGGNVWLDDTDDVDLLEVTLKPMQIRTFITKMIPK